MTVINLNGKPLHFIGIGGIGMSALAYIVAKLNLPVFGSDIRPNHITNRLQSIGAHIFTSQEAANLDIISQFSDSLPQIICSTAISNSNPEYQAAVERGYPIFHRSDLLAALINNYHSIAVAGTHGKTTTSSLISYILFMAGLDPTIIVGGEVDAWEGNARLGESKFLVAEADESDGSLSKHSPKIGVVTNIELDHTDHYDNLEEMISTFSLFGNQCETLIGCIDCEIVLTKLKPEISYSVYPEKGADYTVKEVIYHATGTTAQVWERGELLGEIQLQILGQHNLSNALAAVAVARQLGLDLEKINQGFATFIGAKRRFEKMGECNGITFIDDYAHHPSEIRATLAAARLKVNQDNWQKRLVAIFQPHRYSRTLSFFQEFALSFQDADIVVVTDIYSAGEKNLGNINGQQLADAIAKHHNNVYYQPNLENLSTFLREILLSGDLALFLGAGNLNQTIPELIASYSHRDLPSHEVMLTRAERIKK